MTTLVLSVRVSEEERALLEAASDLARTSLSEFVRRKALDAAKADVLERRISPSRPKTGKSSRLGRAAQLRKSRALKNLAGKAPTWRE